MRRLVVVLLALALAAAACTPTGDPPLSVPERVLDDALRCPATFANRARQPVLLVHGTFATPEENWSWNYLHALPAAGYDVCTVRLPDRATGDIQVASEYVVHAVRRIFERSGSKVDVLGHSQGGLEPRWAVRWWPSLRTKVDDLVTLGTPHHGTTIADLALEQGQGPPAAWQMRTTARFIAALNTEDETPGPISYTSIYTLADELVQPVFPRATAALAGGRNILVQDLCPGRVVDHVGLAYDAATHDMVIDAFTHSGPADPARFDRSTCLQVAFEGVAPEPLLSTGIDQLKRGEGFNTAPDVSSEPPLKPYAQT
jgi:triacylglycerol esterase/lipase EstA (alpha/beta hydrolase family)